MRKEEGRMDSEGGGRQNGVQREEEEGRMDSEGGIREFKGFYRAWEV
jgi:hypothetical protein